MATDIPAGMTPVSDASSSIQLIALMRPIAPEVVNPKLEARVNLRYQRTRPATPRMPTSASESIWLSLAMGTNIRLLNNARKTFLLLHLAGFHKRFLRANIRTRGTITIQISEAKRQRRLILRWTCSISPVEDKANHCVQHKLNS